MTLWYTGLFFVVLYYLVTRLMIYQGDDILIQIHTIYSQNEQNECSIKLFISAILFQFYFRWSPQTAPPDITADNTYRMNQVLRFKKYTCRSVDLCWMKILDFGLKSNTLFFSFFPFGSYWPSLVNFGTKIGPKQTGN